MTDKQLELESQVASKFLKIKTSAKSRNIDFKMSLAEIRRLMKIKTCYYTGVTLNTKENDPLQATFDRVDNNKGYVNGNVVICSRDFNNLKANLTIEQVRLMVKAFKKKKLW